ncbi:MAG TPA: hypothetical protein VHO24_14470 [Opitutaceae bacterium]|nr:hypothetical protein [Opitutaceae bacterium]
MVSSPVVEAPWRTALRGARATIGPGLVLQVAALALVLAYYHHVPTRTWLERLAEFRAEKGFLFGIISTGAVGGLLPFLYLRSRSATRGRYTWGQGAGLVAFWAYKGLEIEIFYRFLARVVGERADLPTILTKMGIDQFLYCPFFAVPTTVLVYAWVDAHYHVAPVAKDFLQPRWYQRRVLPTLISNVAVWVPAVCLIYALPTPLQLPMQNLVLCFFTLMLAHVISRPAPTNAANG